MCVNPKVAHDTALVLNNLGCCLQGLGRLEAADVMYRRAEVGPLAAPV